MFATCAKTTHKQKHNFLVNMLANMWQSGQETNKQTNKQKTEQTNTQHTQHFPAMVGEGLLLCVCVFLACCLFVPVALLPYIGQLHNIVRNISHKCAAFSKHIYFVGRPEIKIPKKLLCAILDLGSSLKTPSSFFQNPCDRFGCFLFHRPFCSI